jgi:hypothetical protein
MVHPVVVVNSCAGEGRNVKGSNYSLDVTSGNSLIFRQRWSLALRLFQVPAFSRAAIHGSVRVAGDKSHLASLQGFQG